MNSVSSTAYALARLAAIVSACLAVGGLAGCTEVELASPQDAEKLANLRADRAEPEVLSAYQQKLKEKALANGQDADALYDNVEPIREMPGFQSLFAEKRKSVFAAKSKEYAGKPANTIKVCIGVAEKAEAEAAAKGDKHPKTAGAAEVDNCIATTKTEEKVNPVKAAVIIVLCAIGAVIGLYSYRSTRRHADTVAMAAKTMGLQVQQGQQSTVVTGNYKDYEIKMESSPPEAGLGDRYMRVIVLSKVNAATVVRFGPVAPPTGLDLPDLDAPEVQDSRLREGYKLRLSPGASAEELLSGDIGFQLRAFDPVDVRVHDGVCGVTCWQIPEVPEKVVDFADLAINVARLYS